MLFGTALPVATRVHHVRQCHMEPFGIGILTCKAFWFSVPRGCGELTHRTTHTTSSVEYWATTRKIVQLLVFPFRYVLVNPPVPSAISSKTVAGRKKAETCNLVRTLV